MYTYLKPVETKNELLTHTQIVDMVRDKYDICSRQNSKSSAPKGLISDLLYIFNDEANRVFYTCYDSFNNNIKRIFTGIDSVEAVFDKIDTLLNKKTAIYVRTKTKDHLLTHAGVLITPEMRKTAPIINIYDLI